MKKRSRRESAESPDGLALAECSPEGRAGHDKGGCAPFPAPVSSASEDDVALREASIVRWRGCNRPRARLLAGAVELRRGPVWTLLSIRGRYYRFAVIGATKTPEVWQVLKKARGESKAGALPVCVPRTGRRSPRVEG